MNHSDNSIKGDTILWADASLESIQADYEEFVIRLREDTGGTKLLRCVGYIGSTVAARNIEWGRSSAGLLPATSAEISGSSTHPNWTADSLP